MTLWQRILRALEIGFEAVLGRARERGDKSEAFTIGVIALGAKLSKADGQVTRDEVRAFREVFHVPEDQHENVGMLFNLARQDVAGFDGSLEGGDGAKARACEAEPGRAVEVERDEPRLREPLQRRAEAGPARGRKRKVKSK